MKNIKMNVHNLLILISVLFLACCSKEITPSDTALKMSGYLQSRNYEKFVDGLYIENNSSAKEIEKSKAEMVALLKEKVGKEFDQKKGIKETEILEETIAPDGQTAVVKVKCHYGDSTTDEETWKFKKVGKEWKMYFGK